ncbi:MAG: 5-(carboxyamino)imidazole ribonucleotide synthase [Ignavibacteria bacterium]|nr:5-(carboxyamino)imidazole ribonucleotide synthase [Ignavibacteria bacterium]
MMNPLLPPATIGIIGGGQLGMMAIREAQRMGYRSIVWDPDPECPASVLANETITAPYADRAAAEHLADCADVITYEFEHIDAETVEWLEQHKTLFPGSSILRVSQHRQIEKEELSRRGFPIVEYRLAATGAELETTFKSLRFPVVVKTVTAGYDGKGQTVIRDAQEVDAFLRGNDSSRSECVVERFIDLQCELSVVVVRGRTGDLCTFPVVENEHRENILYKTTIPANVSPGVQKEATRLAREIAESFDITGVLCVEMFVTREDAVIVNELAPRPHNSGHFSLDACDVSQFEALIRSIAGLHIPQPRLLTPCVMINLLGRNLSALNVEELSRHSGVKVHLYGKKRVEEKRKMGHITVLGETSQHAARMATLVEEHIAPMSGSDAGSKGAVKLKEIQST